MKKAYFKNEFVWFLRMKETRSMGSIYQRLFHLVQSLGTKNELLEERTTSRDLDNLVRTWFLQVILCWFHQKFLAINGEMLINLADEKEVRDRPSFRHLHDQIINFLTCLHQGLSSRQELRSLKTELLLALIVISSKDLHAMNKIVVPDDFYHELFSTLERLSLVGVDEFNEFLGDILPQITTWKNRKAKGVFYTPRPIIEYMIKETVKNYFHSYLTKQNTKSDDQSILEMINEMEDSRLSRFLEALHTLTILDPSMGAGDFLISSLEYLSLVYVHVAKRLLTATSSTRKELLNLRMGTRIFDLGRIITEEPEMGKLVVKTYLLYSKRLYGVDNDELSVNMAKFRLLLAVIGNDLTNRFVDEPLFSQPVMTSLKKGNTLIGLTRRSRSEEDASPIMDVKDAFHWYLEFPEVFTNQDGFSIIVGNPPYVKNKYFPDKEILEASYPIYVGDCDVYTLFYARSYELLSPNGFLTFISKNKWHHGGSYQPFITDFLMKFKPLYKVVDFRDHEIFKGVGVTCNIMFLRKHPADKIDWYQLTDERCVFPIENSRGYEKFTFNDLTDLMLGDEIIKTMRDNSTNLAALKEKGVIDYGKGPSPVPNECFIFECREMKDQKYLANAHVFVKWKSSLRRYFFPLVLAGHVNSPERHVNDAPRYLLYLTEFESEDEIRQLDPEFFQVIVKLRRCIERRKSSKPWFKYDTSRNPHLLKAPEKILSAKMKSNTFRYYPESVAFTSGVSAIILVKPSHHVKYLVEMLPLLNSLLLRHYIMHPSSGIKHDKHRFGFDTSDNIGKLILPKQMPHDDLFYLGRLYHVAFNVKLSLSRASDSKAIQHLQDSLECLFFLIETSIWELYLTQDSTDTNSKEKWKITRLVTSYLKEKQALERLTRSWKQLQTGTPSSPHQLKTLKKIDIFPEHKKQLTIFFQKNPIALKVAKIFISKNWWSEKIKEELKGCLDRDLTNLRSS